MKCADPRWCSKRIALRPRGRVGRGAPSGVGNEARQRTRPNGNGSRKRRNRRVGGASPRRVGRLRGVCDGGRAAGRDEPTSATSATSNERLLQEGIWAPGSAKRITAFTLRVEMAARVPAMPSAARARLQVLASTGGTHRSPEREAQGGPVRPDTVRCEGSRTDGASARREGQMERVSARSAAWGRAEATLGRPWKRRRHRDRGCGLRRASGQRSATVRGAVVHVGPGPQVVAAAQPHHGALPARADGGVPVVVVEPVEAHEVDHLEPLLHGLRGATGAGAPDLCTHFRGRRGRNCRGARGHSHGSRRHRRRAAAGALAQALAQRRCRATPSSTIVMRAPPARRSPATRCVVSYGRGRTGRRRTGHGRRRPRAP